jgi:hypothetical protein
MGQILIDIPKWQSKKKISLENEIKSLTLTRDEISPELMSGEKIV